jgi:hypothetical protein
MKRVCLLLLVGCGLTPQDDLTGKRVGDGIAPWQDLGAAELCLGNDRIGPAGSAVGGFCLDINILPEEGCQADDDCGSRELCVCGRCTVKFCSSNAECGGGVCNFSERRCMQPCRDDDDCPGRAELCSAGVCKGRCGMDDDCQYGEVCGSQGRCVVGSCDDDGDCLGDEFCRVQREPRRTDEPSVLTTADGDGYVMYLEMDNEAGTQSAIWRAVSGDGVHFRFNPAEPLITEAGDVHAPSAVKLEGGVTLFYDTTLGIARADSADGEIFGDPDVVITGDFHRPGAAVTPTGEVLVAVEIGDRAGIAIWDGSGPPATLLRPGDVTDPVLWREVTRVGSPHALVEVSPLGVPTLRVWFDAFGQESAASIQFGELVEIPPNDSLGFASAPLRTSETLTVYPFNPVLDRVTAFLQHRAERAPAVVEMPPLFGDGYLLYFRGSSGDGTINDGIGVARNPPLDNVGF